MTEELPWVEPAWPEAADVPDELVRLAERCVRADGGMPLATERWFLRRRWVAPSAAAGPHRTFALRGVDGTLLAAGTVAPGPNHGDLIVTGLVDPEARDQGLGARLLDHALAGPIPGPSVTVETESLTDSAHLLFSSRGLHQVFAEDVMRIDLTAADLKPVLPQDATLTEWSAESAPRFHAVYRASFRDRPGFPDDPPAEWIADYAEDDEFRPGWSLLITIPDLGDVGFVTVAVGWIVQVGVDPRARGRGLATALITEALSRMTSSEAWLNVNVDNPGAAAVYRRIGFTHAGRRARYRTGLAS